MGSKRNFHWMAAAGLLGLLAGCDLLGIESPAQQRAATEAEGRAVGAACRHAGRAIEDCFTLNPKANKASVFAGWKDMNDYMTKNRIEVVEPQLGRVARENRERSAAAPADPAESEKAARSGGTDRLKSQEKADLQAGGAQAGSETALLPDPRARVATAADSSISAARARAHAP